MELSDAQGVWEVGKQHSQEVLADLYSSHSVGIDFEGLWDGGCRQIGRREITCPRAMIKGHGWLIGALRRTDMAMNGSVFGWRWWKYWPFSVEPDGLNTDL